MSETNSSLYDTFWEAFFHCTMEMDYKSRRVALFFLLLSCFIVGLLANAIVVWVNWPLRHSQRVDVFCTLNMSLSHMMVIALMPCYLLEVMLDFVWKWGSFLCKLSTFIYDLNCYCSSFFLAYLSAQNYYAIVRRGPRTDSTVGTPCWPCSPKEGRQRTLLCLGFWLGAMLLTPVLVSNVQVVEFHSSGCYIMPDQNYTFWAVVMTMTTLIFQLLIPGAIIITYNYLSARALRTLPPSQSSAGSGSDVRMLYAYSAAFVVCWVPYHVTNVIVMVDDLDPWLLNCNATNMLYFAISVLLPLTHIHYLVNPILYNFFNPQFRHDLLSRVARIVRGETAIATAERKPEDRAQRRDSSSSHTSQSDVDS